MLIEVWSDVICPWCYIGKRRLETALSNFAHADDTTVEWRSFELAPNAPAVRQGDMAGHLSRKYGISVERAEGAVANLTEQAAAEGLDFRLDIAKAGNTFDAHRLLHFAGECHRQGALKERLFSAYFREGIEIGLPENLERLASEVGLDAGRVLESDAYADAVHADERRAYDLEVTGVPFFLINNRFMVPGAQDADTMLRVLDRAWEKSA